MLIAMPHISGFENGKSSRVASTWMLSSHCGTLDESLKHLIIFWMSLVAIWDKVGQELVPHLAWQELKDWLSILSSVGTNTPLLKKFIQSVLMYTSWEIWKRRNALLFELRLFSSKQVVRTTIAELKRYGFSKPKLTISISSTALEFLETHWPSAWTRCTQINIVEAPSKG